MSVGIRAALALLLGAVAIGGVLQHLAREPQSPAPPAPPSPDPQLRGFDRAEEQLQSLELARERGLVHEDPVRRRLREAVLVAAARLEFSPCDKQLRPPLRQAIGALLVGLRDTARAKLETATLDDTEVDATDFLNAPAAAVMREARQVGLVYREDLPPEVGFLFPPRPPYPDSGRYGGRFACADGGGGR